MQDVKYVEKKILKTQEIIQWHSFEFSVLLRDILFQASKGVLRNNNNDNRKSWEENLKGSHM